MSEAPSITQQNRAAELALQILAQKPVYIDTETTGLEKDDEVVEISIINFDGSLLFTSLVKPTQSIPWMHSVSIILKMQMLPPLQRGQSFGRAFAHLYMDALLPRIMRHSITA